MNDFTQQLLNGEIKFNICELAPQYSKQIQRINDVEFKKESLSETVISFATLWNKSTNEQSEIVSKIFIDFNGLRSFFINQTEYDKAVRNSDNVKYEANMYRYITDSIIASNESPNFIGFIGYAECEFNSQNLPSFVNESLRNLLGIYIQNPNLDIIKIGILLTYRPKNIITFGEYFDTLYTQMSSFQYTIYYTVLFQLFYALFVLDKHEIMHNDLHKFNILIEKLPNNITMTYKMGDYIFEFQTKHILYIFDWDRGYCRYLGNNSLEPNCKYLNECNNFIKYNDMFRALCYTNYFGIPKPHGNKNVDAQFGSQVKTHMTSEDWIALGLAFDTDFYQIRIIPNDLPSNISTDFRTFIANLQLDPLTGGILQFEITNHILYCSTVNAKDICINYLNTTKTEFTPIDYIIFVGNSFKRIFNIDYLKFYEIEINDEDKIVLNLNVITKNGIEYPNPKMAQNLLTYTSNNFITFYNEYSQIRKIFISNKYRDNFKQIDLSDDFDEKVDLYRTPEFKTVKDMLIQHLTKLTESYNVIFPLYDEHKLEINEELVQRIAINSILHKIYIFHSQYYIFKDILLQLIDDKRFCFTNILYEFGIYNIKQLRHLDKIIEWINDNSFNVQTLFLYDIETYPYATIFKNHYTDIFRLISNINITTDLDFISFGSNQIVINSRMRKYDEKIKKIPEQLEQINIHRLY